MSGVEIPAEAITAAAQARWKRTRIDMPWNEAHLWLTNGADIRARFLRNAETDLAAVVPLILAAERERIAVAIEERGRAEVAWLASIQTDRIDSARIVGAEDAYRDSIRIARSDP